MKDEDKTIKDFQKGLYTSVTELILLSVVAQAREPLYGYQIAKVVEKDREGNPIVKLGTLYPVLRDLESSGLLESHVDPSVTGPPRRYYRITQQGIETLGQLSETWEKTKAFVENTLTGANNDEQH
jgi:PadR family transcriptional regulator PadR